MVSVRQHRLAKDIFRQDRGRFNSRVRGTFSRAANLHQSDHEYAVCPQGAWRHDLRTLPCAFAVVRIIAAAHGVGGSASGLLAAMLAAAHIVCTTTRQSRAQVGMKLMYLIQRWEDSRLCPTQTLWAWLPLDQDYANLGQRIAIAR